MPKLFPFLTSQKPRELTPAPKCDPDTVATETIKDFDEKTIYGGYLYFSYFIAPSLVRPLRHPGDGPLVSKYLWDRVSPSVQLDFIRRSQMRDYIYLPPPTIFISDVLVDLAYDHAERMSREHHVTAPRADFGFRPSCRKPVIPPRPCVDDGWPDEDTEPVPMFWEPPALQVISGPLDAANSEVPQEPSLPVLDGLEGLEGIRSLPIPSPVHCGVLFCPSRSPVPADEYKEWEYVPIEPLRSPWPSPDYLGLTCPDPQANEKRRAAALANIRDKLAYRDGFTASNLIDSSSDGAGSAYSSPSNYPESDDDGDRVYQGGIPLFRMRPAIASEAASSAWEERVDLRGFIARGEEGFDFESSPESGGSVDSNESYAPETDLESSLELEPVPKPTPPPEQEQYVHIARGRRRTFSSSFVCDSALLDVSPPDFSSVGRLSLARLSPEGSILYSPSSLTDDEEDLYWAQADMDHPPPRAESA